MPHPERKPRDLRLPANILLGVFLGGIYVVFDLLSEAKLRRGTLTGFLAGAHDVVDHALPILAGGLIGLSVHYLRVRAELARAEEAARRAEALRDRLQKIERDQAVWVLAAAVLHELNNPLHALGLILDELLTERDSERSADLVARARAQSDRTRLHLETLRKMRSVDPPEFEPVSLGSIIKALASDVEPLAREQGFAVVYEGEEAVHAHANAAYVRTILENLVDNSLHSLRGRSEGSITIRLATEAARAVIRVRDDGPPVSATARTALFEPLRTTKAEGLGLGLPIARALARAMQGDLFLDEGVSKAFRLELPLGRELDPEPLREP